MGANANQTVAVNFGDVAINNIDVTMTTESADSRDQPLFSFSKNGVATTLAADDVLTYKVTGTNTNSLYNEGATVYGILTGATISASAAHRAGSGHGWVNDSEYLPTDGFETYSGSMTSLARAHTSATSVMRLQPGTPGDPQPTFTLCNIRVTRGTHAIIATTDITTSDLAAQAVGRVDLAINAANTTRASLGASMSWLDYASDKLANVVQNSAAARSRITNTDYVAETTELARMRIIDRASAAVMAQANQSKKQVLSFLRPGL